jgi:hypothetical protein
MDDDTFNDHEEDAFNDETFGGGDDDQPSAFRVFRK